MSLAPLFDEAVYFEASDSVMQHLKQHLGGGDSWVRRCAMREDTLIIKPSIDPVDILIWGHPEIGMNYTITINYF